MLKKYIDDNLVAIYGNISGLIFILVPYGLLQLRELSGESSIERMLLYVWLQSLYILPGLLFGLFIAIAMKKRLMTFKREPGVFVFLSTLIYAGVLFFIIGGKFLPWSELLRRTIGSTIGAGIFISVWIKVYKLPWNTFLLIAASLAGGGVGILVYIYNSIYWHETIFLWQSIISILMNFYFKRLSLK